MKKLFLTLFVFSLTLMSISAQQQYITVKGHAISQPNNAPVSGQTMIIVADSILSPGYKNQVVTDKSGLYTDYIPIKSAANSGSVKVYTSDCTGALINGIGYYSSGVTELIIDFTICSKPTTSGCAAFYTYKPASNDMMTFAFTDSSYNIPETSGVDYQWYFGDGGTSTERNPVYTYINRGVFTVMLYISSKDNTCHSQYYLPVEVGSAMPQPCETRFTFQIDSASSTYTFESKKNNPNIDSWKWDFGDGTNATGQIVTHTFPDPAGNYSVCLITSGTLADGTSCNSIFCQDISMLPPSPCENTFGYQLDASGTNYLFAGLSKNSTTDLWEWDFGDGTIATGQKVSHSFNGSNSQYTVCLTTSGPGTTSPACQYQSCQDVFIYPPHPCANSFTYHFDSTGTECILEGFAKNPGISSWIWDFGDGSFASGQKVSHSIIPNTTMKVCLSTTAFAPDSTECNYFSCQEVNSPLHSTCSNYFNYQLINGSTYSFSGYLKNEKNGNYYWDFGDGETAFGQSVQHTFKSTPFMAGFNVCLTTLTDDSSATGVCKSMNCQIIFPGGGLPLCKAEMAAYPDYTGYNYQFKNMTGGNISKIYWDFGDGSFSTETNPKHSYNSSGTYIACLSISDTVNNCSNQTCQEIWVNQIQDECQASFFNFPSDSTNALSFVFISTANAPIQQHYWSFGDGTFSNEPSLTHIFQAPGNYEVCHSVWDSSTNCKNTQCTTIFVGEVKHDNSISGIVTCGSFVADQGLVWIIGTNNKYNDQVLVDSTGIFHFTNVPSGSYYIYAMLIPGSDRFFGFMPTYYPNSLTWQGAMLATTADTSNWYSVNLIPSNNYIEGGASISGSIRWFGALRPETGNPASHVEIILFNSSGNPVAYTFSNADGSFEFNNLPPDQYTVQAELAGKNTGSIEVELTENSSAVNINFAINQSEIVFLGITDQGVTKITAGNPYPNPVNETLYLDLNGSFTGTAEVEIIDMQGRILSKEKVKSLGIKNQISISTSNITKGVYLLRIQKPGLVPIQRKFIK